MLFDDKTEKRIRTVKNKISTHGINISNYVDNFMGGDIDVLPHVMLTIKTIINEYSQLSNLLNFEVYSELKAFEQFKRLEQIGKYKKPKRKDLRDFLK